jgi:hypothetical protein
MITVLIEIAIASFYTTAFYFLPPFWFLNLIHEINYQAYRNAPSNYKQLPDDLSRWFELSTAMNMPTGIF